MRTGPQFVYKPDGGLVIYGDHLVTDDPTQHKFYADKGHETLVTIQANGKYIYYIGLRNKPYKPKDK